MLKLTPSLLCAPWHHTNRKNHRSIDSSRGSPYSHQDGCMMWLLPDEIIMSLLGFLSIDDLCSVVQVPLLLPST